jgi:hypothetical protein
MQIIVAYPSILALEEGQALEKSRCFGQTGRAEGKNRGKQTMFEPTRFSGPLGPARLGGEFGLFRRFLGLFGQNSDKIFRKPCFEGLSSLTFCLLFGLKK